MFTSSVDIGVRHCSYRKKGARNSWSRGLTIEPVRERGNRVD